MRLKQQETEVNTPKAVRNRFRLATHRRIGLLSLAFLLLGGTWVINKVLPGLQKSADNKTKVAGLGWFSLLVGNGSPKPAPSASPPPTLSPGKEEPAVGTVETVLINAPVGTALQGLLASARYTSVCDPSVVSTVTYTNSGTPHPFWEIVGRVIGAAPAPSAHIVPYWDAYRILPRNVIPVGRDVPPSLHTATVPPVPLGEGHTSHRMAGYILLNPNGSRPPVRAAIMETRIPGDAPRWRVLFVGDPVLRKSPTAVAQETDPRANIDVVPVVETINADHLVLRGGGDKRLRVPLSKTGVTDVFGFQHDSEIPGLPSTYSTGGDRRLGGSQSSEVY